MRSRLLRRDYVLPVLLLVGLGAAALVNFPWYTLTFAGAAYLVSLPLAFRSHRRLERNHASEAGLPMTGGAGILIDVGEAADEIE